MSENSSIWDYVTESEYTLYGAWKVYAEVLTALGEKVPPSQMMYNYARQGMLVKGQKLAKDTMRKVTDVEVATFIVRMVTKKGHQVLPKVNKDQLELDIFTEPAKVDADEIAKVQENLK